MVKFLQYLANTYVNMSLPVYRFIKTISFRESPNNELLMPCYSTQRRPHAARPSENRSRHQDIGQGNITGGNHGLSSNKVNSNLTATAASTQGGVRRVAQQLDSYRYTTSFEKQPSNQPAKDNARQYPKAGSNATNFEE
jgi:hypothetical protein